MIIRLVFLISIFAVGTSHAQFVPVSAFNHEARLSANFQSLTGLDASGVNGSNRPTSSIKIRNTGSASTLVTANLNSTNFSVSPLSCTIAAGNSCDFVFSSAADTNGSYSDSVRFSDSNGRSWATATLSGTATGIDPCTASSPAIGAVCNGGAIYIGTRSGKKYMMTPSGCPVGGGTTTCSGSEDLAPPLWWVNDNINSPNTLSLAADGIASVGVLKSVDSSLGKFPVASYCENLVVAGYSDWYLPARDELTQTYDMLGSISVGGFVAAKYWTSTAQDFTLQGVSANLPITVHMGTREIGPVDGRSFAQIRCIRRS